MFESPWILIIVAVVLFCGVAIFRNAKPEKARWWQLLLPLLVLGAAFAIDYLVETDTEKIQSRITTARDAVIARDSQTIISMIDENYQSPGSVNKESISSKCRQYLGRPFADKIKINSSIVTINNDEATCAINVTVHLNPASDYTEYVDMAIISAKIDFVRRGDDWFVSSVVIEKINNNEPPKW